MGYTTSRLGMVGELYLWRGTCRVPTRLPRGGGGLPLRQDRVHDRGRTLPEHYSGVALPPGLMAGRC